MNDFKKNIANILTVGRGILTLIIIGLFYIGGEWKYGVILVLFVVAMVTDWLDGKLARKYNSVSKFGVVFDSMLDKVMVLSMFMLLIAFNLVPGWILVLLLVRELIVDSIKGIYAAEGKPMAPLKSGKYKMALETFLIIACLLRLMGDNPILAWISYGLAGMSLITAYYSGWKYISGWWKRVK